MTVSNQLKEFLKTEGKFVFPKWLQDETMKVYVRKAKHLIDRQLLQTLDIGSVEVVEEKRNQGIFKEFLEKAHELNPWQATYVENVLNEHLAVYFVKNGWISINKEFPFSFALLKLENYFTN